MREIELTVQEQNGSLSLQIKDVALGETGKHRGSIRLSENPNHAEFYQVLENAISDYKKDGCIVTLTDANGLSKQF